MAKMADFFESHDIENWRDAYSMTIDLPVTDMFKRFESVVRKKEEFKDITATKEFWSFVCMVCWRHSERGSVQKFLAMGMFDLMHESMCRFGDENVGIHIIVEMVDMLHMISAWDDVCMNDIMDAVFKTEESKTFALFCIEECHPVDHCRFKDYVKSYQIKSRPPMIKSARAHT